MSKSYGTISIYRAFLRILADLASSLPKVSIIISRVEFVAYSTNQTRYVSTLYNFALRSVNTDVFAHAVEDSTFSSTLWLTRARTL